MRTWYSDSSGCFHIFFIIFPLLVFPGWREASRCMRHQVIRKCHQCIATLSAWISGCWQFARAERNIWRSISKDSHTGFGDLAVIISALIINIVNQGLRCEETQIMSTKLVNSWSFCSYDQKLPQNPQESVPANTANVTLEILAQSGVKVFKPLP